MNCSLPSSSVHGTVQSKIQEWIAISFSRGSRFDSLPRDQTCISLSHLDVHWQAGCLPLAPPGKPLYELTRNYNIVLSTLIKSKNNSIFLCCKRSRNCKNHYLLDNLPIRGWSDLTDKRIQTPLFLQLLRLEIHSSKQPRKKNYISKY